MPPVQTELVRTPEMQARSYDMAISSMRSWLTSGNGENLARVNGTISAVFVGGISLNVNSQDELVFQSKEADNPPKEVFNFREVSNSIKGGGITENEGSFLHLLHTFVTADLNGRWAEVKQGEDKEQERGVIRDDCEFVGPALRRVNGVLAQSTSKHVQALAQRNLEELDKLEREVIGRGKEVEQLKLMGDLAGELFVGKSLAEIVEERSFDPDGELVLQLRRIADLVRGRNELEAKYRRAMVTGDPSQLLDTMGVRFGELLGASSGEIDVKRALDNEGFPRDREEFRRWMILKYGGVIKYPFGKGEAEWDLDRNLFGKEVTDARVLAVSGNMTVVARKYNPVKLPRIKYTKDAQGYEHGKLLPADAPEDNPDLLNPNTNIFIIGKSGGRSYYVDLGYCAPEYFDRKEYPISRIREIFMPYLGGVIWVRDEQGFAAGMRYPNYPHIDERPRSYTLRAVTSEGVELPRPRTIEEVERLTESIIDPKTGQPDLTKTVQYIRPAIGLYDDFEKGVEVDQEGRIVFIGVTKGQRTKIIFDGWEMRKETTS